MKARILHHGAEPRKETPPEENAKESPTKRREGEKEESHGWWDEFDKPTKARIMADCHYRT